MSHCWPSLPSLRIPPRSPSSSPPALPRHGRASLADDITIVGGNQTGIFVSHVRAGSPAEQCGLKEGSELLEVCLCMVNKSCVRLVCVNICYIKGTYASAHAHICISAINARYRSVCRREFLQAPEIKSKIKRRKR